MIRFVRAHGLGNDYLITDFSQSQVILDPVTIRLLCHRHLGIGSDGLLCEMPPTNADFGLRIFNPDGSEAEKSGNGLRIFTRYLYDEGRFSQACSIETRGGIVHARVHPMLEGPVEISVDMGHATFDARVIPLALPISEAIDLEIALPAHRFSGTAVSVGNPHWVMFVPDVAAIPLPEVGPQLERHPWFPHRTNVQFAQVLSGSRVKVRIWERGAGETLASGSSACAVVAAGLRTGRLANQVTVQMDGGSLEVSIDAAGLIRQRGPVTVIARGQVSEELEAQLLRDSAQR